MARWLPTATLFILIACKHDSSSVESIPVIGLDKGGKSTVNYIPEKAFKRKLGPFFSEISNQVTTTLERYEPNQNMPWTLSRVSVGLGIESEFEIIDEMIEAEVESDIEFRFQKI
jgi:hypothetical protein